jgi:hypothetical protein
MNDGECMSLGECCSYTYVYIIYTIHIYIHPFLMQHLIYHYLYLIIGKTTLETYLLQHHIWLTSNAKTLLTIVNDSPWINFALASLLFVVVAKELYRLTMSLR